MLKGACLISQNKARVLHNSNASRASLMILYRYLEIGEFAVHSAYIVHSVYLPVNHVVYNINYQHDRTKWVAHDLRQ